MKLPRLQTDNRFSGSSAPDAAAQPSEKLNTVNKQVARNADKSVREANFSTPVRARTTVPTGLFALPRRMAPAPTAMRTNSGVATLPPSRTNTLAPVPDHSARMPDKPSTAARVFARFKTNMASPYRWRPDQQFSIVAERGSVIVQGGKTHRNERKIPDSNLFDMQSMSNKPLAHLDRKSRLTLHGHGNTSMFYSENATGTELGYRPAELARFLADAGLTEVGVLKFKACQIGKSDYLPRLVDELSKRGIRVGYVSGPTGDYTDMRLPVKIGNMRFNFRPIFFGPPKMVGWKPEKYGLRTAKGNVDISFSGTRYDLRRGPSKA